MANGRAVQGWCGGAAGLAGVLCAAGAAAGQVDGQAAWLWEVTTQDGDAIVEPGETATVTLSIDMRPSVGEEMVLGFAAAEWNVLGSTNATNGMIGDFGFVIDVVGQEPGETDGTGIFGVGAAQPSFELFYHDDPIELWSFEWIPEVEGSFLVEYLTETTTLDNAQQVGIWVGDNNSVEVEFWPIEEAAISFQVVPAPAGFLVVGVSLFVLSTRPRRHI